MKPLVVNIRAVTETKSRTFQQHSMEDVTKSSLPVSTKINKTGNAMSDPRFKRFVFQKQK